MEDTIWAFVDQNWKDSLYMAAAEPAGWEQGADHRKKMKYVKKGEPDKQVGKKTHLLGST